MTHLFVDTAHPQPHDHVMARFSIGGLVALGWVTLQHVWAAVAAQGMTWGNAWSAVAGICMLLTAAAGTSREIRSWLDRRPKGCPKCARSSDA